MLAARERVPRLARVSTTEKRPRALVETVEIPVDEKEKRKIGEEYHRDEPTNDPVIYLYFVSRSIEQTSPIS